MNQPHPHFKNPGPSPARRHGGFTLLEVIIAAAIASILMICIYGVFSSAIKMRDNATERNRMARLRGRAVNVIRTDLENALVSGGILASTLQGDSNGTDGGASFPGYLRFTTTGGKDTGTEMYGDVQQVEYYIVRDPTNTTQTDGGDLVRTVTRDLLDSTQNVTHQEQVMSGVKSFQVAFYDGSTWQPSWQISGSNSASSGTSAASTTSGSSSTTSGTTSSGTSTTLPEAIRVDIQPSTPPGATQAPAPVEILVPWTTTPFLSGTNYSVGSGSTTSQ